MPRTGYIVAVVAILVLSITLLELSGQTQVAQTVADRVNIQIPGRPYASAQYCKWEFSHYEANAYETEWLARVQKSQDGVCEELKDTHHQTASRAIVSRTQELQDIDEKTRWTSIDDQPLSELDDRDKYMSRMYYIRSCFDPVTESFVKQPKGLGVQLIEPLFGILRDPFDIFCGDNKLLMENWHDEVGQSKAHIMPQGFAPYAYDLSATEASSLHNWRSHGQPPWISALRPARDSRVGLAYREPSNIHIDFGSSYFGQWTQAGNAAASGKWFYNHFHKRGLEFDRFIAVELERLDPNIAFQQIPTDLVGKYTLMNVGMTMDKDDKLHALDMISRVVQPEDFFVFKLDIDSAPIEDPIVQMLLHDDSKSALVDELMFEHHVKFTPMSNWWGLNSTPDDQVDHLIDSYKLFQNLRKKGIRAHSWP